jgi:hypothetical protein
MKRTALYALLVFGIGTPACFGQIDDFNDGNDAGWTRYNPIGVGSWSLPNGNSYRIRTAPSPDPMNFGPGRAGSLRNGVTYTNFYVAVDVINWDDTVPQAFGILARVTDAGPGATKGYAFTFDRGTTATSGDVDISVITGEVPTGLTLLGEDSFHLVPGRTYRFVFIGTGPNFEGRVYEHPNLTTPVVQVMSLNPDATYGSGVCGLVMYDNSSNDLGTTDATFDNYFALDVEPPRLTAEHGFFGDIHVSWPDTPGFDLQGTPALSGGPIVWTDITEGIVLLPDGRRQYTTTRKVGGNQFYRLRRQQGP